MHIKSLGSAYNAIATINCNENNILHTLSTHTTLISHMMHFRGVRRGHVYTQTWHGFMMNTRSNDKIITITFCQFITLTRAVRHQCELAEVTGVQWQYCGLYTYFGITCQSPLNHLHSSLRP